MLNCRLRVAAPLVALCCLGVAAPASKLFTGPYFTVGYSASFAARKSLADSAFFRAKDRSVEFYVFSPIWNGDPKDVAANPAREAVVTRTRERRIVKKEEIVVIRETIRAKNGAYIRYVEDTENKTLDTRHVFGIKVKSAKVMAKWRAAYLAFKKSLVQYAD